MFIIASIGPAIASMSGCQPRSARLSWSALCDGNASAFNRRKRPSRSLSVGTSEDALLGLQAMQMNESLSPETLCPAQPHTHITRKWCLLYRSFCSVFARPPAPMIYTNASGASQANGFRGPEAERRGQDEGIQSHEDEEETTINFQFFSLLLAPSSFAEFLMKMDVN